MVIPSVYRYTRTQPELSPYLNVSEMPGKVAGIPMRRKRNEQRSPVTELSTRGILDVEVSALSQSFSISFNVSAHSCSRK